MELFSARGQIDLYEDFTYSLNYSTASITSLTGRKASYTKTIKVPYTSNNANILQGLGQANSDNVGYDTRLGLPCFLQHQGKLLIEGILIVLSWTKLKESQEVEVQIIARTKSLVDNLKGITLNALDFDYLNHSYTIDNITDSFNGYNVVNGTLQARNGYVYPLVDYGKDDTIPEQWEVKDLRPCLYLREIVDNIFRTAGLTYSSVFFNSPYFNSLVLINTLSKIKLNDQQLSQYEVEVQLNTNFETAKETFEYLTTVQNGYDSIYNQNEYYYLPFDLEVTDPSNQEIIAPPQPSPTTLNGTPSTGNEFTASTTGTYNFTLQLKYTHEYGIYRSDPSIVFILQNAPLGALVDILQPQVVQSHYIEILKNGVVFTFEDLLNLSPNQLTITNNYNQPGAYPVEWTVEGGVQYKNFNYSIDLQAGDTISFRSFEFQKGTGPAETSSWVLHRFNFEEIKLLVNLQEAQVQPGDTINFTNYIPEIKATEFIDTLFNTFNLWVIDDPYQQDRLIVEPRTNFFDLGGYVNWTEKLDVSRTIQNKFLADVLPKRYRYNFSESEDVLVKQFKEANNVGYADYTSEVPIDFTNSEEIVKTSLTPLISSQEDNGLIYPKLFTQDNPGDPKGDLGAVLKIGFVSKRPGYAVITDGVTPTSILEYIHVGEFDNPIDPTYSLTFGEALTSIPQQSPAYWTLYRLFHEQTEIEKTRKGAKLVTLWVYLNPNDIALLDLRRVVFINQVYYRIVQIKNYDPLKKQPTQVELLQIEAVKYDFTSNEIIYKTASGDDLRILATNRNEPVNTNINENVQTN